ncbi:ATP-BINDING CASSETTE SUB-FAMILY B [Salix purpurea]|uniref:ATP-BINDING CASSETTE SUB-FAMILY B n=1 Tax=Salix purpurea TaxID=77065 RepID=A0A9Q0T3J3_SALPP|nr:ATP-BINDING CASSETTE SUB-FAMILY B [Salix purpurea]
MSQESLEIKTTEQWKWSEMQGLELVSEPPPDPSPHSLPFTTTPAPTVNTNSTYQQQESVVERREMESTEPKKDGTSSNGGGNGEKPDDVAVVGFGELFRFADGLDYVLMGIGSIGAFVHGCSLPIFLRFFADLVNSFGSNANNMDKMMQEVLKYAFYFLIVGAAIWASSWAGRFCCSFLLGNFIHYMATFVSGFVVGFTAVWQLALVTLAVVPLIAVIGGIHATTLAKLSGRSQEALSQAGNIVEQTIVQIRVVLAFVGESRALQAYSTALKVAQRIGYKSGFSKGMGLGATYFVVFCCYALLLWYGGYLVRHHYTNGGLAIATMFAVMIGGLGIGQAIPSMGAFAKAKVAAAKIFRIINHKPTIDRNSESGLELESVTGLVALKNIDFAYPSRPDAPILNNFSLNVPGSVSEIGTHDELIAKGENGVYAKLIKMQEAAHETALNNARKSSARPSSARNSVSSPIIARNSSYGRSPYSRRLSDFSTSDFSLSLDAQFPNYRLEKLAFKEQASSFWRLAKMNSPEWVYALVGSIGSVICGSLSAFFAYVLSAVLSVYYNPDHAYMSREIAKYCYLLIGLSSAALIFNTLQHSFWDIVGENLTKRVREKMLTAVLKNEIAWFDQEENESARIAARLALDANNVRSAIGDRISVIVQNTALMLVACTAGFVLQWRLALVLIAVFPLVVAATVLQKMFMNGFSGDLEAAHSKATQLAGEAIANVRTVAAFNSEAKIVGLFSSNLETPLRRCFWKGQIAGSGFGIAQFSLYASYALGLWYASWLVKHGISDFSNTIRVFMVLMVSANGAAETLTLAPDFIKGGRAMRSVFDLLDRKTEIEPDDPDATPVPDRLRGEVELKHVDFSYPTRPDIPIFRDLNLRARAGKILALVGPSGCGKSSVIALVQRFYEPSSGRVMIDGKDIRKYNLKSLRKHIAIVPQEPCLFATTIYENIAYGSDSATEAEIIEAATLANAHKIPSLSDVLKEKEGDPVAMDVDLDSNDVCITVQTLRWALMMLLFSSAREHFAFGGTVDEDSVHE